MKQTVILAAILAIGLIAGIVIILRPAAPRSGGMQGVTSEPGAAPVRKTVPNTARKTEPARPARPERAISGHVFRSDGKPFRRAQVRCMLGPEVPLKTVFTDSEGFFFFEDLDPNCCYSIEASARTSAPERQDNVEVGATGLVFTLTPGGRLSGRVYSADVGMPLPAFTVEVSGPETRSLSLEQASGFYVIEGLRGGKYTVRVSAEGYEDVPPEIVVVKEGKNNQKDFLLPPKN